MKKLLTVILSLSIMLSITACGDDKTAELESKVAELESKIAESVETSAETTTTSVTTKVTTTTESTTVETTTAETTTTTAKPVAATTAGTTAPSQTTVATTTTVTTQAPEKVYGLNEEFTGYDSSGTALFTLKINNVTETDSRNEYNNINQPQVVIINYSYTNLAVPRSDYFRGMYLDYMDFKVLDSKDLNGYVYPIPDLTEPKDTPIGETCNAQVPFGLDNISDSVTITLNQTFFSNCSTKFYVPIS